MDRRKKRGAQGEDLAAQFLTKKGFRILAKGFRTRFGEIDIIASDGKLVRFVEVKTRTSELFGKPEESVTDQKLQKIAAVGIQFLQESGLSHLPHQIDVVAVMMNSSVQGFSIRHIENVGEDFFSIGNHL